jgi:hypothetical protein
MSMVGFPLLLIPIAIYNIIAFLMPGVSFADTIITTKLISGADWPVTLGDALVALGVLLLLLEVIKGARPGAKYLTDHLLSLLVFGAAAAEFLMWSKFASSTYFLLTLLAMVDFLTGIALRRRHVARVPAAATVSARPTVAVPPDLAEPVGASAPEPEAVSTEPVAAVEAQPIPEPAPAPEMPPAPEAASAASIAESVLMEHPESKIAREPNPTPTELPVGSGSLAQ